MRIVRLIVVALSPIGLACAGLGFSYPDSVTDYESCKQNYCSDVDLLCAGPSPGHARMKEKFTGEWCTDSNLVGAQPGDLTPWPPQDPHSNGGRFYRGCLCDCARDFGEVVKSGAGAWPRPRSPLTDTWGPLGNGNGYRYAEIGEQQSLGADEWSCPSDRWDNYGLFPRDN